MAQIIDDLLQCTESVFGPKRTRRPAAFVSAFDAVDGSSTRHVSAMDVGAVKAPTIRRS